MSLSPHNYHNYLTRPCWVWAVTTSLSNRLQPAPRAAQTHWPHSPFYDLLLPPVPRLPVIPFRHFRFIVTFIPLFPCRHHEVSDDACAERSIFDQGLGFCHTSTARTAVKWKSPDSPVPREISSGNWALPNKMGDRGREVGFEAGNYLPFSKRVQF